MQKRIVIASLIAGCVLTLGSIAQAQPAAAAPAAAAPAAAAKASPVGTWEWVSAGRNGGPGRTNTLVFKMEADKLTGVLKAPGGPNGPTETKITDAKIANDDLTFSVTREFGGNSMTSKYSGKVTADTIKGKIDMDRDGQTMSRDWEAKRLKEVAK
jgi:hypothetical protein